MTARILKVVIPLPIAAVIEYLFRFQYALFAGENGQKIAIALFGVQYLSIAYVFMSAFVAHQRKKIAARNAAAASAAAEKKAAEQQAPAAEEQPADGQN